MTLDILNNRSLALIANLDIQDTRIERLVLELLQYFVVVKHKCARRTAGTIDDCGNFSSRDAGGGSHLSLSLHGFRNQIEFISHD